MISTRSIKFFYQGSLCLLFVTAFFLLFAGCSIVSKKPVITLVDGFSSPESVLYDALCDCYYISNVGAQLKPSEKDSDGFISKVSPKGKIINERFLPTDILLHAPKGMAIIERTLYVTDIDKIIGFDLITQEKIFELDFSTEKTVFLNDLAVINNKTLAVSATDINSIYTVSLFNNPGFMLTTDQVIGANGLYYDQKENKLYVVGFGDGKNIKGELGVISLNVEFPVYTPLTDKIGGLDGLERLSKTQFLFSDWVAFDKPGLMRIYDIEKKELRTLPLSQEVRGPADFYFNPITRELWLPKMMEGKLLIEELKGNFFE